MSTDRDPRIPDIAGDIAGHDLGRAKERLCSFLNNEGYDPDLCAEIGDLCVQMQDPREAGRWYFVSDDVSINASSCIELFLDQHGHKPEQIIAQLPRRAKLTDDSEYPEAVRVRFERLKLTKPLGEYKRFRPRTRLQRAHDSVSAFGCGLLFLCIVIVFIIGLVQVVVWLWSLIRP